MKFGDVYKVRAFVMGRSSRLSRSLSSNNCFVTYSVHCSRMVVPVGAYAWQDFRSRLSKTVLCVTQMKLEVISRAVCWCLVRINVAAESMSWIWAGSMRIISAVRWSIFQKPTLVSQFKFMNALLSPCRREWIGCTKLIYWKLCSSIPGTR